MKNLTEFIIEKLRLGKDTSVNTHEVSYKEFENYFEDDKKNLFGKPINNEDLSYDNLKLGKCYSSCPNYDYFKNYIILLYLEGSIWTGFYITFIDKETNRGKLINLKENKLEINAVNGTIMRASLKITNNFVNARYKQEGTAIDLKDFMEFLKKCYDLSQKLDINQFKKKYKEMIGDKSEN